MTSQVPDETPPDAAAGSAAHSGGGDEPVVEAEADAQRDVEEAHPDGAEAQPDAAEAQSDDVHEQADDGEGQADDGEEQADDAQGEAADAGSAAGGGGAVPRRSRSRWISAVVFAVVAVLIAGVAWLLRPQPPASSVPSTTPQEAVAGYLNALVEADANRALEYALNRPTDTTLLTDEVLKASHKTAKLAVVNVPEVEGRTMVTVPAQVTLDGEPATINFSVSETEVGWRLGQVTSTIDPGTLPTSLETSLNGVRLTAPAHIEVFPGIYVFDQDLPQLKLEGNRVAVTAVGEDIPAGLHAVLTSAGEKAANKIAAAALKKCLAKKDPNPDGCPNSVAVDKNQKIDTKSIRWNLVGDPWKTATYTVDATDPTQIRGATTLKLRFRCTLTEGGEKYTVDQTNSVKVRYALTVTDAKEPVVWQRVA